MACRDRRGRNRLGCALGPVVPRADGGGHSDWIPRTTLNGILVTVSSLATNQRIGAILICAGVGCGGIVLCRSMPQLGRVWVVCFAVPLLLAAIAGLVAPVLLDRTLTLGSWAPLLALAAALDWALTRWRAPAVVGLVLVLVIMVPVALGVVTSRSGPDGGLRRLQVVAQPGDVVAVRSAAKLPEIEWSLGVRGDESWRVVTLPGIAHVAGILLGTGPVSGRVWLLDWNSRLRSADGYERCAPDWNFGVSRILCLQSIEPVGVINGPEPPDDLALTRSSGTAVRPASLQEQPPMKGTQSWIPTEPTPSTTPTMSSSS